MTETAHWEGFYVMAGGAAAVLTGLIFVAVSLHTTSIVSNDIHRDRAWSSVAVLLSQLFIAMAVLVPEQPGPLLGLEIVVIAAFWIYRTVRVTRELSSEVRRQERPHARWQVEWAAWLVWVVTLVAAGITLTAGNAIGLPLLAVAMVGMFGFGVWNAWVLISEVSD
jgi:Ca2+/Na+ antiporter